MELRFSNFAEIGRERVERIVRKYGVLQLQKRISRKDSTSLPRSEQSQVTNQVTNRFTLTISRRSN